MKNFAFILLALILIGAGCANTSDNTTQAEDVTDTEVPVIEVILDGDPSTPLSVDMEIEEVFTETDDAVNITMESGNFFFSPDSITASAGQEVSILFSANTGFHTFVIDEVGLNETVEAGGTITFTAPNEPGSYAFYCDVGSHRAFGMEGTLIVE